MVDVGRMDTVPGVQQHFSAPPVGGALRHSILFLGLPNML